jgi:integrase
MCEFISFLAPSIQEYITFRKASDRWSETYEERLSRFDKHCKTHYPNAAELTQEMADSWCRKHKTETNNSCRARSYPVISFIKFLRERGKTEISEPVLPREERRTYIPHAFSETELKNFFRACDELPDSPHKSEQLRKITVPVLFRLLYSSGLRTVEARMLKIHDADLKSGVLSIRLSKSNDEHYVVLDDSMLKLMKQYDTAVKKISPVRTYFFPDIKNSFRKQGWVRHNFKAAWNKYNGSYARVYDLRHNYAIENINSWTGEGFGFHAKFLYLSKSMGHSKFDSTKYYYNLVPGFADILRADSDSDIIIPEVTY